MIPLKRIVATAIASVAIIAAAGCGGDGDGPATVAVKDSELGKYLVDASGNTLYLFEKDAGNASSCFGPCAGVWPPFTSSGKPTAGGGVSDPELGTTRRKDGRNQVTYHGHPLYRYEADNGPGDMAGQELDQFGAEWYVLSPTGDKLEEG